MSTDTTPAEGAATIITHTDPETGEVSELAVEEAAELAADLEAMLATAEDTVRRARLELDALRGKLQDALGLDTPAQLLDGRRVVFTATDPPRRVHPGACETHRDALLRLRIIEARTETTYTTPTLAQLKDPKVRAALAAEGIPLDELSPPPTPRVEMHVVPPPDDPDKEASRGR